MNDIEIKIRDIVKKSMNGIKDFDVNQIDAVDKEVNLKDLGFDSITYVKVTVDIEGVFDIELPLDNLVMEDVITIQSLCDMVEGLL